MATPDELDVVLAQATNPLEKEMNMDAVQKLCHQVLLSRDAPQEMLKIMAHKIQSPQEREALRALEVLEECVSRCGGKLNNEVGKFRFLNELIRVVSPKYLGQRAPESVKRRVVEILYKWSVTLAHETKIVDAYQMLKRQGVVAEDPIHVLPKEEIEETVDVPPPREDEIFTDKQKELELKRLLNSKHPEDLQAANRLIKSMVKEADRKIDLKARKRLDIEEAKSNCALFSDLLENFRKESIKSDELELLQQIFENCDKLRPKLFTLASEFSLLEDFPSVEEVLRQNDELTSMINNYKDNVAPLVKNPSATTPTPLSTATSLTPRRPHGGQVAPSNGENLNFDSLSKSGHSDDVSLLDSHLPLTISSSADALISIEHPSKSDNLVSLLDLNLNPEALSTTVPQPDREPLKPEQLQQSTKQPTPPPPSGIPSSKVYASFEGLDKLMSQSIMGRSDPPEPSRKTDLSTLKQIALVDIIPSTQPPVVLCCQDEVTTLLHITENDLAQDVMVVIISTTNRNSRSAVKDFRCHLSSSGQLRNQDPSGDQLPVFNPILPSTAITQIGLLEKQREGAGVRVSFLVSYKLVTSGVESSLPVTVSGEKVL